MRETLTLRVRRLSGEATLPKRYTFGWHLCACLISETGAAHQAVLPPRESRLIPTGLSFLTLPSDLLGLVCSLREPAKGPSAFWVTDSPSILLAGETKVLLYNGGSTSHYITHGQPIAQLVVMSTAPRVDLVEMDPEVGLS